MFPIPFNPKLAGAAVVALALLCVSLWIWHLKSSLAEVTAQKVQVEAQLNLQNAAIRQMKIETDAREQAGKVLVEQAKKEAEQSRRKATAIYKSKPSDPKDLCKSALSLINEGSK